MEVSSNGGDCSIALRYQKSSSGRVKVRQISKIVFGRLKNIVSSGRWSTCVQGLSYDEVKIFSQIFLNRLYLLSAPTEIARFLSLSGPEFNPHSCHSPRSFCKANFRKFRKQMLNSFMNVRATIVFLFGSSACIPIRKSVIFTLRLTE